MPKRNDAWPQGTPCWVDCQVDDTTAARTYYTTLFGWDVQDNPADAGGYLMALLDGSPAAGIGAKSEGMDMPSAWTTYFAADSADDIAARVSDAGGQIVVPAFDVLDVGRMLVAADPTGAVFGVWEAKAHNGAGIYNENGAYCWNELHTHDYATAQKFYEAVFGFTYNEIGDGTNFVYSTFALPTGGDGVGGINDEAKMSGEPHPAYWLTWFQVGDVDGTLAKAGELGSTVLGPIDDGPFGRMAVVRSPQGEVFGLIDPSRAVGDVPGR